MKYLAMTLLGMFLSLQITAQQRSITLLYETDKSVLTRKHIQQLDEFLSSVRSTNVKSIRLYGHTDSVASDAYNDGLSYRRALGVQQELRKRGFEESQINMESFGENQPDPDHRNLARNRRVVVQVLYHQEREAKVTTIADLYKQTENELQTFCIRHDRDTLIRCKYGTTIIINANSFHLSPAQQQRTSCIELQVKEVYTLSEMVLENLSTTADGSILETMGMLYIDATLDKQALTLKKDIVILKPTDEVKEGMKLFDGERDPHSDVINWTVSNNSVLRNFTLQELNDCNRSIGCTCCAYQMALDTAYMYRCYYMWGDDLIECWKRCKLLCRASRFYKPFHGMLNEDVRKENQQFRWCQEWLKFQEGIKKKRLAGILSLEDEMNLVQDKLQRMRKRRKRFAPPELNKKEQELQNLMDEMKASDALVQNGVISKKNLNLCGELDSLFKVYGVANVEALTRVLNKPLLDEFGVETMEALLDTLPKVNLERLEVAYQNKSISYADFKFYIFNTSKLGWKNVDAFADIPEDELIDISILLRPDFTTDCKLIFKERKFVLPPELEKKKFHFNGIPKDESAILVAIKYENGIPFLSLSEILTRENGTYNVNFKEMSLEELKERLSILDFE